jgi:hypothetical protein
MEPVGRLREKEALMTWVVTPYGWDGKAKRSQRYSTSVSGKTPRELADDAAKRIIAQRAIAWVNVTHEADREPQGAGNGRYR